MQPASVSASIEAFFRRRNYTLSDFQKRFPSLDFETELKLVVGDELKFKPRHRISAQYHLDRINCTHSDSSDNDENDLNQLSSQPDPANTTNTNLNLFNNPIFNGPAFTSNSIVIQSDLPSGEIPSSNAPKRRRTNQNQNEDQGDESLQQSIGTILRQPVSDESLRLPSGASLQHLVLQHHPHKTDFEQRRILYLEDDWVQKAFSPADLEFIMNQFPDVPEVPPFFDTVLDAYRPLIKNPRHFPTPPTPTSDEEWHMWHYISTAVWHFVMNFKTLSDRSTTHGEVWADVNIGSTLWDFAFLKSSTLSIDRKELRVAVKTITIKHDGIVRSTVLGCGRNLGFLEVKAMRHNSGDGCMATDSNKVIDSMIATLLCHNTPGAIVMGILCCGMKMNILRATLTKGNIVLLKELPQVINVRHVFTLIRHCWMMKLALEESYEKILDSVHVPKLA